MFYVYNGFSLTLFILSKKRAKYCLCIYYYYCIALQRENGVREGNNNAYNMHTLFPNVHFVL
jgi:hypothetical protein